MKDVVVSSVINTFWIIWFSRNLIRLKNKLMSVSQAQNMVVVVVTLTGNLSHDTMFNSITEIEIIVNSTYMDPRQKSQKSSKKLGILLLVIG